MKNVWKKLTLTVLTGAVLTTGMSAFAAPQDVTAKIFNGSVYVEGQEVYCWNPQGKQTDYLVYNGSTYIPVRTAGEWMGKTVSWDESSKAILLTGTAEKVYHEQTDHELAFDDWEKLKDNGMTVKLRDDIKIVMDGKERPLKNAKGEAVYPINYNNMNYLPVRSIGELSGMTVKYNPANKQEGQRESVYLRSPLNDTQIEAGKSYIETLQASTSYKVLLAQNKAPQALQKVYHVDDPRPDGIAPEDNIFNLMYRDFPDLNDLKEMATLCVETMQLWIDTPKPDCAVLDYYYTEMQDTAKEAKTACETVLKAIADGKDVETCRTMLIKDSFPDNICAVTLCVRANQKLNYMNSVLLEN